MFLFPRELKSAFWSRLRWGRQERLDEVHEFSGRAHRIRNLFGYDREKLRAARFNSLREVRFEIETFR